MDDSDEEPLLRPGGEERQNLLGENSGDFFIWMFSLIIRKENYHSFQ